MAKKMLGHADKARLRAFGSLEQSGAPTRLDEAPRSYDEAFRSLGKAAMSLRALLTSSSAALPAPADPDFAKSGKASLRDGSLALTARARSAKALAGHQC